MNFADRLLRWYDQHGRKDLPWQNPRTPYAVWVSEIMLQQTQVATVIPFFERFMASFPNVAQLAKAPQDNVLHHWTGLGYYARARNLHKAAQQMVELHDGDLPNTLEQLEALPGVGRSTAGAILAQGFNERAPILDGNVKRVLTRHAAIDGYPGQTAIAKTLWALADDYTPPNRPADYTQAIMDLGATLCRRSQPNCPACPVAADCQARQQNRTAELPTRKPKKVKPVRTARMYLVRGPAGDILLEQRPQAGIWGGLWTPPERDTDQDDDAFLIEEGLTATQRHQGPTFRHTFSHYHLDITPVFIEVETPITREIAEVPKRIWYQPDGAQQSVGLSAVAVKLIEAAQQRSLGAKESGKLPA